MTLMQKKIKIIGCCCNNKAAYNKVAYNKVAVLLYVN